MTLNNGFTFDGVRKDYVMTIGKRRSYFPPIRRNFINVASVPGAYLTDTQIDVRTIEIDVEISATDASDLRKKAEDFAAWLKKDEVRELIFDDETDRVYYAIVDGDFKPSEIVSHGYGTITFVCPDPYKYGLEQTSSFENDQITVNNGGTVETYPTITATVTQATTFLAVTSQDDYMLIGNPSTVEDTTVNPFDSVLYDGMDTTVGWAQSSITVDGGVKSGTLSSSGGAFTASDYGTGSAWHGPVMQRSLSQQVQDFQIDITGKFETTSDGQIGRFEVYLLDVNNKVIGKLAMKDYTNASELTMPEVIIRNDTKSNAILVRNQNDDFDNFYGLLRLKRVGQEFWAYVIKVDAFTGKQISVKERYFLDVNSEFQSQLSSIAVHFGAYGTYATPGTNQIHEISVNKINAVGDGQIAYIAQPGDVIEFNHKDNSITKNGESVLYLKDFVANFFPLQAGYNTLTVQPSGSADVMITYQEKFL